MTLGASTNYSPLHVSISFGVSEQEGNFDHEVTDTGFIVV